MFLVSRPYEAVQHNALVGPDNQFAASSGSHAGVRARTPAGTDQILPMQEPAGKVFWKMPEGRENNLSLMWSVRATKPE